MKRLLLGSFIALGLLGISHAEPLCEGDIDCFTKFEESKDIRYLEYGCDNYKDQSFGHSCTRLYIEYINKMLKDVNYLCDKGNMMACMIKVQYNMDLKYRDKTTVSRELREILKRTEEKCENEEDDIACVLAYKMYKVVVGNPEKARYYLNKVKSNKWTSKINDY
jgi:hypothetical protein